MVLGKCDKCGSTCKSCFVSTASSATTTTAQQPTPSAEAAHDSERISWIAMTLARLAPNPLFGFYATEIARRNLPPESFKPRPAENRNDKKPNE
ncbi:hypothetical protein DL770_006449 [Monosporascus sp. CRB-9-2]|nr:hypothetical protein DL770_006449 [Monosporascus sp. CRB-9-2]